MVRRTTGAARWPGWTTRSAATIVLFQVAVFVLLVLFMNSSLDPASIPSRILNRDTRMTASEAKYHSLSQDAVSTPLFDVNRAVVDLENISKTPHSLNDMRSIDVRDYLRKTIWDIIKGSSAEFSDPVANGTAAEFKANDELVYWEDSSLVVRVPGTGDRSEALLVQAHYDAVPMSHGAFDDGVGVVVCLELLRSLVRQPTRHPVLINIDWGEENGLFGATLFARFHPWAESVRAYVNLEAGGVGGRAMLFRASHQSLLQAYKQAVSKPYASLVGNDAFKLGIVKSDTDYSVYTARYGIPGLDFAFADHRTLYHTERDNIQHVTAESVLSMGVATLSTARQIADSEHILPALPRSPRLPERPRQISTVSRSFIAADESFGDKRENISIANRQHIVITPPASTADDIVEDVVFYDVLSWFMVVRSYSAELLLNLLTGVIGIVVVVAVQYPFMRALPGDNDSAEFDDNDEYVESDGETNPRVIDYHGENSDSDANERVILLGSGDRNASIGNTSTHNSAHSDAALNSYSEDSDDELGRRQPRSVGVFKGESPETVGMRMIYMWAGIWLALWVLTQLVMLAGDGYNDSDNPLKVRVFHSTRIPAECIGKSSGDESECSVSRLSLSSPDSVGLAKLVNIVAPSDLTPACFTLSTRGFFKCNFFYHSDNLEDVANNTTWSPKNAITIANISRTVEPSSHGTRFNVALSFMAPETRTCFVDFGSHRGYSPQAYPNPHPVPPPANASRMPTGLPVLTPVISRVVLPVIEHARFVKHTLDKTAFVSEPISDRDPVFSGRILAHKHDFDSAGLFTADIQYSVPVENATSSGRLKVDISCYFDQADRHTPLLASIIGTAPEWAVFTPDSNSLSTVTLVGVEI
ncbi:hypothetical protein GGH12_005604 [Coemansia sp. RSA 1822]|nr:hypothetical protein GGH12_005604 [Coemansia sp. RSA 1822]